jgi:ribosomal protein L21E
VDFATQIELSYLDFASANFFVGKSGTVLYNTKKKYFVEVENQNRFIILAA